MSSSADTAPISPSRFAAALKDLSISMLHLKVLEIRNSIAHLQYSNDQLRPFAQGAAVAISSSSITTTTTQQDDQITTTTTQQQNEPDQDCIDAIKENEIVIDRMIERIALIRQEVEHERGLSWSEFQAAANEDDDNYDGAKKEAAPDTTTTTTTHTAWSDGTFQTGTISNGQAHLDPQPGRPDEGRGLDDDQLRRALEERLGERLNGNDDADDADGGMYL